MRIISCSFIPILLKLLRCLDHALTICMWFGYNPQIHFGHIFHNFILPVVVFLVGYTKNMHVVWIHIFSDYISVTIQLRRGT